jgi:hypothetical protein
MMSSKMPPVPPAERSDKGPGSDPKLAKDTTPHGKTAQVPNNADQQGRTGNSHINTTNQGYQQDR